MKYGPFSTWNAFEYHFLLIKPFFGAIDAHLGPYVTIEIQFIPGRPLEEIGGKEAYDGSYRKSKGSKHLLCHK
jgi:hypothetical protein